MSLDAPIRLLVNEDKMDKSPGGDYDATLKMKSCDQIS
jgi:hypothetical protein